MCAYFVQIEGERYVAVAETRDNVGNTHHGVTVYIWNVLTRQLSRIQQIPGDEVVSVSSFNAWDKGKSLIHAKKYAAEIYCRNHVYAVSSKLRTK